MPDLRMAKRFILAGTPLALVAMGALTCSPAPVAERDKACGNGETVLKTGFYAYFEPVSYSADEDPNSEGFNEHLGYEADLLTALEAMEDARLSFERGAIGVWPDIWLMSAGVEYDIVGGGITILESRTLAPAGEKAVNFTSGHIAFRQSLLSRAGDVDKFKTHADLNSGARVGVLAGTTGEARLLQITGLADGDGVLVEGVRVETPSGDVIADGGPDYTITSAGASPKLEGRRHLQPPSENMPQLVYLGDELGEVELLEALEAEDIDAVARGEIGNIDAERDSAGAFAGAALDDKVEYGGFTLSVQDDELLSCIDERLNYLTDNRRFGYSEWRADPSVFMRRAQQWNDTKR